MHAVTPTIRSTPRSFSGAPVEAPTTRQPWEQQALEAHFARVLADLRAASAPDGDGRARARTLDRLQTYANNAIFPENRLRPEGRPRPVARPGD